MNDRRRTVLANARELLEKAALLVERAADEESDCFSNLPESIQEGERGEKMEAAIDLLEEVQDQIDEILDKIEEASA